MNTDPTSTAKKKCIIEFDEPPHLIQFHLPVGQILALPYGHLLECMYGQKDDLEYVYLLFSTKAVTLSGLRLQPVVQQLSGMKVKEVHMVVHEEELEKKSGPWITAIQWRQSGQEGA